MAEGQGRRILMISLHGYVSAAADFGKPDTGGQVVFVIELARRFARLGNTVDIVTRRFQEQPAEEDVVEGVRIRRVPFGGPDFIRKEDMHDHLGDFITNFLADANRRGTRYDVVNSHYWDAGWASQRIAEELRIPHIHTPHSIGWWKRSTMKGSRDEVERIYRFDERINKEFLVYRNCDHVIATSNQQVDLLIEHYDIPDDHISMIPPGMDESRFTPASPEDLASIRQRLKFRDNDVYCVGRAATNKGVDLLIRALPPLRNLVKNARLCLAMGANSKRDQQRIEAWKKLARELKVYRHIRWLGYIPDEEMADYYRAAGAFALPSRYEPFGMTAIEAMACGTPTVLTTYGGLKDAIDFGRHALFADPKRPEEFAAMLAMPMRYHELQQKLSIEGARFARRSYGWTGIAKRSLAVFDRFHGRYAEPEEAPRNHVA